MSLTYVIKGHSLINVLIASERCFEFFYLLVFKLSCEFLFMFQLNTLNNLIPNQGFVLPKTHVFHRRGDGSETLYDVKKC